MNDFEKIEHLLLNKKFEELSPTEVKEVNGYFENANDYNDIRDTLMQVKSTLAADKLLIKPNIELKEKLLQQFDKTYANQTPVTGAKRPFYKNIGFQWAAAASVVIIISVSIFGYINNIGGHKSDEMAVNYNTKQSPSSIEEESSVSSGETSSPDEVTGTETGKERVIVVNPENQGSTTMDEADKNMVYGNYFGTEADVKEEEGKINNAPISSNNETDLLKDGFTDNTTLGGVNTTTNVSKEEKKDADRVLTNAYRDDNTNYQKEDTKSMDQNTTIQTNSQSQNVGNTTKMVDQDKVTTKKDYWSKRKNKNKTKTDSNKGGIENANLAKDKDSVLTRADSLRLDSNKNLMKNNGDIQMEDNKKDE